MVEKNIVLQEIQNQKELAVLFDTLNSLPTPEKRSDKLDSDEKISVILSSDDNYACFVATTGASILYNTNSFIEFYVLSEGITDKNKQLIRQTFESITPHFSLKFVECDSKKAFSSIKLREGYYVSLSTCNRLLVPTLIPELKRAIYLDVDLIVLDDIKKLWDEKLDGHIFGCVTLYYDRLSTVKTLKGMASIPDEPNYHYFNSGVMLIDYDRWRALKGGNDEIIQDLFNIMKQCDTAATPDEIILNKFAYENGGYKVLPLKYNAHTNYSYNWLKKNKKSLCYFDKWTLEEFEKMQDFYKFDSDYLKDDDVVIHHFFGGEKPWFYASSAWFAIPLQEHFEDFWFYAKLTPFFNQIKRGFISKHMAIDYSQLDEFDVTANPSRIVARMLKPWLQRKQRRYKTISKFTFGKMHKKYKEKYNKITERIKNL